MVHGCTLSMLVLELTVMPGLPADAGAPMKPLSPFGMSRGGTSFRETLKQQFELQYATFHLPDLLHSPPPPGGHPNHLSPENQIT